MRHIDRTKLAGALKGATEVVFRPVLLHGQQPSRAARCSTEDMEAIGIGLEGCEDRTTNRRGSCQSRKGPSRQGRDS